MQEGESNKDSWALLHNNSNFLLILVTAKSPLMWYLSGRLDQRCRAQTGAVDWRGVLYPLQQDPGSGDVTPRHTKAWLHLPAATSRYMVCYLQAPTTSV